MKTVTRMEVAHVALTAVWAALLIGSAVLEHRYLVAALFAGLVWCVGYSGYLIGMWLVRRRIQHLPARLTISQEEAS